MKIKILFLTFIIGLGAFFRFYNLNNDSLRLDETQSIWQASHNIETIYKELAKNVHLPLHNTLLHFWMRLFGSDPSTVRIMSVIPGILALPAFYLLCKEIFNEKTANVGIVIAAISPFWIWYSREIRMYSILSLVTTLSYYFYLKVLKSDNWKFIILYTLINIIGIYTHYYFTLVLLVQVLYFFLFESRHPLNPEIPFMKKFFHLSLSALISFVSFIPWLLFFLSSYIPNSYSPSLDEPTTFSLFMSMYEFIFGYQAENVTAALFSFWPIIILLGFAFLIKQEENPFPKTFYFVMLGILIPLLTLFGVSVLLKPVYLTRYLIPITPMFYILIAWYLVHLEKAPRVALFTVLIGMMLTSNYLQYNNHKIVMKEDYRSAVTFVEEHSNISDLVLVSPPYTIYPVNYYYEGDSKLVTMPIWDKSRDLDIPPTNKDTLNEDTRFLRQGHKRMFLILSSNIGESEIVKEYFEMNYTILDRKEFSKDLWVYVFQADYEDKEFQGSL